MKEYKYEFKLVVKRKNYFKMKFLTIKNKLPFYVYRMEWKNIHIGKWVKFDNHLNFCKEYTKDKISLEKAKNKKQKIADFRYRIKRINWKKVIKLWN